MTIPARAHFIWIGSRLPWAYVFALLSAAERSGLDEVILQHTDALEDSPQLQALVAAPGISLVRLDVNAVLREAGATAGVDADLIPIYERVENPAAKSDILRTSILYLQGGIYLDMDTITTASLLPLLDARMFIGSEYIVWPGFLYQSRSPVPWARALGLDLLRKPLRILPGGWKLFRKVERLYYRGINGAVMGAEAGATFLAESLREMTEIAADNQGKPNALGPNLLQKKVAEGSTRDVVIHPPETFYPLPPEISEHWFRFSRRAELESVLYNDTRVAHWYASVRTKSRVSRIDPDYVRKNRQRQLYSALVCANIRNLPETA